jgi:hypothetical protein
MALKRISEVDLSAIAGKKVVCVDRPGDPEVHDDVRIRFDDGSSLTVGVTMAQGSGVLLASFEPPAAQCGWTRAWIGKCQAREAQRGRGYCIEHLRQCGGCGAQAVTECDAQVGGLMCGVPVCKTCCHSERMFDGKHGPREAAQE